MMSTRRSLFTLVAVGLMMVASAASAVAQATVDQTAATALAMNKAFGPGTPAEPHVAKSNTTYDGTRLTWTIADEYKADCTVSADGSAGTCVGAPIGSETPLTGVMVYYSTKTFAAITEAGVMSMKADSSGVAASAKMGYADMEDLKPSTQYFIRLAAANAHSTAGQLTNPVLMVTTLAAPPPDQVRGVTVTPGNKELVVSWTAPHPGGADQTDVKNATYDLQYRESETTTSVDGDWMPELPEKPISVKADMTMATIEDLENGVMYDVRVRAVNTAGGKGTYSRQTTETSGMPSADATATPALPLFGILGLGAGLVAAGRRRLRRRQALLS
jgi:hypothetical protein